MLGDFFPDMRRVNAFFLCDGGVHVTTFFSFVGPLPFAGLLFAGREFILEVLPCTWCVCPQCVPDAAPIQTP
jgi:hypothetical protein